MEPGETNTSRLKSLRVANPCPARWEDMKGDERSRFCSTCSLNVYNISAMTSAEAEEFLRSRTGRTCTRFYQRADGTVITRDCPVALAKVRRKLARAILVTAGFCMSVLAVAATRIPDSGNSNPTAPWVDRAYEVPFLKSILDKIDPGRPTMGDAIVQGAVAHYTHRPRT